MSVGRTVRVAICDDSRTYSHALKRFLEQDGELEVVGSYSTAEELLGHLPADRPDIVTMDLELPGIDGVKATERIMSSTRPIPVIVLSAHVTPGSERAAAALAGGAVEAILKSSLRLTGADAAAATAVRRQIKRLARAHVRPLRPPTRAATVATPPAARGPRRTTRTAAPVRAIGMTASTGGPQALAHVLGAVPASFPVPILVVQHMSVGFTAGLATWLDRQLPLPARLGTPGVVAGPGIWFAPDEAHMTVNADLTLGRDTRTAGRHRPSADVLFASMATSLGANAAAVVLTGLGRDGASGVAAMVAAGGFVIAQDTASSVVDGMPGAAADAGAQAVMPLEQIAGALQALRVA